MRQKSPAARETASPAALLGKAIQQYQSGQLRLAEQNLRGALAADASLADAEHHLGLVLVAKGEPIEALEHFRRAMALKPRFTEAFSDLAQTLFVLAERGHAAAIIKRNPTIQWFTQRAKQIWPVRLTAAEIFPTNGIQDIAQDSYLLFFLGSSRLRDAEIEQFLTGLRHAILEDTIERPAEAPSPPVLGLYCALARQCFINEYVFSMTARERELLQTLRERIVGGASGLPPHLVAVFAGYAPLHTLPPQLLAARPWPQTLQAVIIQQVEEPHQEQQLRETMPRLTAIEDEVSLKVRGQYEENPYPRWVVTSSPRRKIMLDEYLRASFPHGPFKPSGANSFDLLIAGCGTGQLVAGMAQLLEGARVLAVDLSLASLAYAKRMCTLLGLKVEFAQADILKLPSTGRSFDVISTTGVLHHMADPTGAWHGLVSMLRPGGFMHVGLYSEIARQDVSQAWKFIADGGYGKSADEIRRCREDILALPDAAPIRQATLSPDFYSLSDCRDLLFHEHELRVTLPRIKRFLADERLEFIGWDIEQQFLKKYAAEFPHDKAKTNLDHWYAFEQKHPFVFAHMYKFWAQKRA